LQKIYKVFNFIGSIEKLSEHGPMLLKRVGIYEKYGANGWSLANVIKDPITPALPPERYIFDLPKVTERDKHMHTYIYL